MDQRQELKGRPETGKDALGINNDPSQSSGSQFPFERYLCLPGQLAHWSTGQLTLHLSEPPSPCASRLAASPRLPLTYPCPDPHPYPYAPICTFTLPL
jgi:hypothetical protein